MMYSVSRITSTHFIYIYTYNFQNVTQYKTLSSLFKNRDTKMKYQSIILLFAITLIYACSPKNMTEVVKTKEMPSKMEKEGPRPAKKNKELITHGDTRIDEYYWMRLSDEQKNAETPDAHTQEVLDYLNAENDYRTEKMSHTTDFQSELFDEIVGRIKQTDLSVPYKRNGYYYLTRYEEGKEYPIFGRKENNLENEEQIMLDANVLAENHDYFQIGGRSVSPDNTMIAYGEDTLSRRIYTIRIKNLKTGEMVDDVLNGTTGSAVWANDNQTLYYTVKDKETLRSFQIYRHTLGTPQSEDTLVFEEKDDTFYSYVYKTKSQKYIVIGSSHTLSNEYRYLDANDPNGDFELFQSRDLKQNLEYSIAHYNDKWYIRTNLDAKNFRLMETSVSATSKDNWTEVIPNRDDVFFEGMDIFQNYLVLSERKDGITELKVRPWEGEEYYIDFPEKAHLVYTTTNVEFDTDVLRLGYQSMKTPNAVYDYNMQSKERVLLKQQEVVGTFSSDDYISERIMVPVRDGELVPVSLVYHKNTELNGKAPCLQYAYGSYGSSMDPYFSSPRLSLLDRGFVYAIAHIRGGEEMGRRWYEDGKLLNKKNTFYDFIDCGQYLIDNGYSDKNRLFGMGGSAGGLLIGAVINIKPEIWNSVIAAVPFVDVVTTMLDETIPLTTFEWDEWGDPRKKEYYDYMKSYSPYDNVEQKDYPAMLVTTGLFDSQVQYWEPAKWVARLRDHKTDNNPLYMYCNMETGHGGASGRFERHKETAMEYAFLLDQAGLLDSKK